MKFINELHQNYEREALAFFDQFSFFSTGGGRGGRAPLDKRRHGRLPAGATSIRRYVDSEKLDRFLEFGHAPGIGLMAEYPAGAQATMGYERTVHWSR